jgi:glycosyl hydrolase family 12
MAALPPRAVTDRKSPETYSDRSGTGGCDVGGSAARQRSLERRLRTGHGGPGTPAGGTYTIQNNEWGSGAPECSAGGLSANPVQASAVTAGQVTTSWNTTQPGGGNDYDVAYDIWFNQTPTTSGQPNGAELMIWLNHNGRVQPFGSQIASGASIGGRGYNVWFGNQGWNTISYTMTTPTTSVSNLDLAPLVADAISRGYIQNSWYLIDIEAGFELWQGGAAWPPARSR